jgi:hypothetical protein
VNTDLCPDIWDLLHDAIIIRIEGRLPGTLALEIECDYLRDRFPSPGERFILTLSDCTRFEFRPWTDGTVAVTRFDELASRRLWVLSAERGDGCCKVRCNEHIPKGNGGELWVSASACEVCLDDGTEVSLPVLKRVVGEYWEEFSSSGGRDQ